MCHLLPAFLSQQAVLTGKRGHNTYQAHMLSPLRESRAQVSAQPQQLVEGMLTTPQPLQGYAASSGSSGGSEYAVGESIVMCLLSLGDLPSASGVGRKQDFGLARKVPFGYDKKTYQTPTNLVDGRIHEIYKRVD